MKGKTKGNNLLIMAGLGIGALLLLSKKSKANTPPATTSESDPSDIPDTPKILAINTSDTESPVPTAVVSDEEGMEAIKPSSGNSSSSQSTNTPDSGNESSTSEVSSDNEQIPPFVSSTLTPKEKEIVNKAKLSAELAVRRPDLYKAAYIKKYGGKSETSKKQALQKAAKAIDSAVQHARAAKGNALPKAKNYPAHPEYTFVQSGKSMLSQTGLTKMSKLQKKGVAVSPNALKTSKKLQIVRSKIGKKKTAQGSAVSKGVLKKSKGTTKPTQHASISSKKKLVNRKK